MSCPHVFVRVEKPDPTPLFGRPDPHPLVVWVCVSCGEQGHPIPAEASS